MSEDFENNTPAASRIDAYVDGSWLSPGKENPAAVGGCGVVIVENGVKRIFSRPATFLHSHNAELEAALLALRSIHENEWQREVKPEIVLKSDQFSLRDFLEKPRDGKLSDADQFPETLLSELGRLATQMQVKFEYTRDPKSMRFKVKAPRNPHFEQADNLAGAAAWTERFRKQGYVHFKGIGKLEGEEAERYLSRMAERGAGASRTP